LQKDLDMISTSQRALLAAAIILLASPLPSLSADGNAGDTFQMANMAPPEPDNPPIEPPAPQETPAPQDPAMPEPVGAEPPADQAPAEATPPEALPAEASAPASEAPSEPAAEGSGVGGIGVVIAVLLVLAAGAFFLLRRK
jgi:uncharacterized membrane protein